MNSSEHAPGNRLFFVLGLVFFVRVLCAFVIWHLRGQAGFFEPDTGHYLGLAQKMLHGSFDSMGFPEVFRTPGYPLLLLPAVASHHPIILALLENFLLSAASTALIWKIASDLLPGSQAGFWAGILYCFEPMGLLYSEKILTETLFTTLLLAFVWIFLRCLREPTYKNIIFAALVLGCATYVRPVGTYLSLALALLLLFIPRTISTTRRLSRALLFAVVFAVSLAPWMIRNAIVADYVGFSSVGDFELYFYCSAAVQAKVEHRSLVQQQVEMGYTDISRYLALHPEQRGWSPGQSARFFRAESKRILLHNPGTYAALQGRGCIIVLFDPGATELMKAVALYPDSGGLLSRTLDQGLVRATLWFIQQYPMAAFLLPFLAAILAVYYGLALVGWRRLPLEAGVFLAMIAFYFVLISGTPAAVPRFRVPIMPLVCICAGVAIASRKAKRRQVETAVTA
ncbi:MAG TPA: glycosyltransferase family 39 protein [Candidatus Angelobacter sp.]